MNNGIEIVRANLSDATQMGLLHSTVWRDAYKDFVPEEALLRITPKKRTLFYEKAVFDEVYPSYVVKKDSKNTASDS
ncbi:MAG: hypothetical protein LBU94_02810 [Clostridiales bacterium]|jgi:hypothetical protein|nr:hypothetical protein [Clostridiales bacterium]